MARRPSRPTAGAGWNHHSNLVDRVAPDAALHSPGTPPSMAVAEDDLRKRRSVAQPGDHAWARLGRLPAGDSHRTAARHRAGREQAAWRILRADHSGDEYHLVRDL